MQLDPLSTKQDKDPDSSGKFICTECKIGIMYPAIQEGEPEYTDNFICQNCQFHDTIPKKEILFNQILTGIAGCFISIYLLITRLASLFSGIQHDKMQGYLTDC